MSDVRQTLEPLLTLDVGGALAVRAHGDPKGEAFGIGVDEIDVLRRDDGNPHDVKLVKVISTSCPPSARIRSMKTSRR